MRNALERSCKLFCLESILFLGETGLRCQPLELLPEVI